MAGVEAKGCGGGGCGSSSTDKPAVVADRVVVETKEKKNTDMVIRVYFWMGSEHVRTLVVVKASYTPEMIWTQLVHTKRQQKRLAISSMQFTLRGTENTYDRTLTCAVADYWDKPITSECAAVHFGLNSIRAMFSNLIRDDGDPFILKSQMEKELKSTPTERKTPIMVWFWVTSKNNPHDAHCVRIKATISASTPTLESLFFLLVKSNTKEKMGMVDSVTLAWSPLSTGTDTRGYTQDHLSDVAWSKTFTNIIPGDISFHLDPTRAILASDIVNGDPFDVKPTTSSLSSSSSPSLSDFVDYL
jgi:hypothetical protein